VFNGVSQRCLKLSGEVEALIRGDEVVGAQVEVVVEPVRNSSRIASRSAMSSEFVV